MKSTIQRLGWMELANKFKGGVYFIFVGDRVAASFLGRMSFFPPPLPFMYNLLLYTLISFFAESELMVKSSGHSCLPEDCAMLCVVADSLVVELVKRIVSGEVTMKEFENVQKKKHQVEKLCSASQECKLDFFQQEFKKREAEYQAFRERRIVLSSFCREMEVAKVNVEGNDKLSIIS